MSLRTEVLGVSDPVSYTAVLPVRESTVLFVSGLLAAERRRRGTRGRRRALGCFRQAVLVLRWFLDGTRLAQLAADNRIGRSTAYRYLHEGIDVLAAAAPGLRGALLAARTAGHSHVTVDGTLVRTDRVRAAEALPLLAEWTDQAHAALADLGYEGERATLTIPIKHLAGRRLTADQRNVNLLHAAIRAPAERGNSLLKTTFKALRRVSLCPGASARSPPPPLSCSTTSTAALHDHRPARAATGSGSPRCRRRERRGQDHFAQSTRTARPAECAIPVAPSAVCIA